MRDATIVKDRAGGPFIISILVPLAGRDVLCPKSGLAAAVFQSSRPLRGATSGSFVDPTDSSRFQSSRPLRGATRRGPRRRGWQNFNPRAPYGARREHNHQDGRTLKFQSSRPLRGATTWTGSSPSTARHFNPRAPYGARPDTRTSITGCRRFQSSRPLRGATFHLRLRRTGRNIFQSSRPLRGATLEVWFTATVDGISILAPLTGRD